MSRRFEFAVSHIGKASGCIAVGVRFPLIFFFFFQDLLFADKGKQSLYYKLDLFEKSGVWLREREHVGSLGTGGCF